MARRVTSLTPTGGAAVAGAIGLGALGVALGYLALTVIAAGIVAALIGGLISARGVPALTAEREIQPLRVERGRPAMGLLTVGNNGHRRSRPCTAIETLPDRELPIAVPRLAPGGTAALPYRLPTARRGTLAIGPLVLTRSDPLGLWETRRHLGGETTLFVQPRIFPLDPRPVGRKQHLEGPVSDTAPRGTLTFHTLREYVPGDDVRRIHWKTSARTGTLMVREHVDTSLPSTVVVLDTRRDRYDDERFESAVDVAASVVAASQRRGFPVRFVTTTGELHLVRPGHRGQELSDRLTAIDTVADGSMELASVAALGGRDHDAVVVVAGEVDRTDLAVVTQFVRRFGFRALVTVRPSDSESPSWPAGRHLDGEHAEAALAGWLTGAAGGRW